MGRLFDNDSKSFTALRFIKICKNNIELFNLSALRERKVKSSSNSAEWIDEYMVSASSITLSDFDKLNGEVVRAKEKYAGCEKIRNKLVAHSDEKTVFSTEPKLAANIEDIKSILFSLYQVYNVVLQYYQDGMPSAIGDHVFKEEEYVTKDVAALIGKLVTS